MLSFGHSAAGYLISKKTNFSGLWFILAANIFDLDIFIFGPGHHGAITHTPLMGVIYLFGFYLLLRNKFSHKFFFWIGVALLSHLIIDDLSYWLSQLGWEKPLTPQINWFFPFTRSFNNSYSATEVLTYYFVTYSKLFYLEIFLSLYALTIFFRDKISGDVKE